MKYFFSCIKKNSWLKLIVKQHLLVTYFYTAVMDFFLVHFQFG